MIRSVHVALALSLAPALALAQGDQPRTSDEEELAALGIDPEAAGDETVFIVEKDDNVVPGAAQAIDARQLERFEHDDVHRILGDVSGVYIREEEGYGLRPNIGMRGSGSERSAKIALMEDGILIAPAPYSAPAAYYFPLLTRMTRVEVLKGPASVRYGPNTVGGALNMITKDVPRDRESTLDVALGNDLYGKLHGSHAESYEHFGVLIEGLKLRTDGFKRLDGGGDTGFDKNNIVVRARINTAALGRIYNEIGIKLGYSDEISNETYTGLTDDDFAADPYRRYRATALDRMEWTHTQLQLSHKLEVGGSFSLFTRLYRHDFERSWKKLNGFGSIDRDIGDVLANPGAGNNAVLYSILTGATDSTSDADALLLGTNDRVFVSQGIQTEARLSASWLGIDHELSAGLRLHNDQAERFHTEESYMMLGGQLVRDAGALAVTRDTVGSATALAFYVQEQASYGRLTVSVGNRLELVSIEHRDTGDPTRDRDDSYAVVIPGGGVFYKIRDELGVLAGVHKGFVPVAPGQSQDIEPEESTNYELGARFGTDWIRGEAIAFFNDYSNLKGTCSFSSGCAEDQVDDEFNGGAVHVLGVEASASAEVPVGRLTLPLRATYTFNRTRFQSGFSSSNPQWGDVEAGFEIPYLPTHQASVGAGVSGRLRRTHGWEVSLAGRFTSAMRDAAGNGNLSDATRTDAVTVIDAAASYTIDKWGKTYLTVSNIFDQAHVVSRRPFGARPGKPRFFIVGYKNSF